MWRKVNAIKGQKVNIQSGDFASRLSERARLANALNLTTRTPAVAGAGPDAVALAAAVDDAILANLKTRVLLDDDAPASSAIRLLKLHNMPFDGAELESAVELATNGMLAAEADGGPPPSKRVKVPGDGGSPDCSPNVLIERAVQFVRVAMGGLVCKWELHRTGVHLRCTREVEGESVVTVGEIGNASEGPDADPGQATTVARALLWTQIECLQDIVTP